MDFDLGSLFSNIFGLGGGDSTPPSTPAPDAPPAPDAAPFQPPQVDGIAKMFALSDDKGTGWGFKPAKWVSGPMGMTPVFQSDIDAGTVPPSLLSSLDATDQKTVQRRQQDWERTGSVSTSVVPPQAAEREAVTEQNRVEAPKVGSVEWWNSTREKPKTPSIEETFKASQFSTVFGKRTSGGSIAASANYANDQNFGAPDTNLVALETKSGAKVKVNAAVAGNFAGFINELESLGYHIDAKQTGGFVDRNIDGSTRKSQHAYGNAIDVNWNSNTDRQGGKNNLPPNVAEIAAKYGLTWGGNWKRQDTMHFEYHPDHGVPPTPYGKSVSTSSVDLSASPLKVDLSAYSPKAGGDSLEGGYAASKAGPDGKAEVRTLTDFAEGKTPYITVAGNPRDYGKTYIIPQISWMDNKGRIRSATNVRAVVHDTGGAFTNAPEGRFDIPIDKDASDYAMGVSHRIWKKSQVRFLAAK